MVMAVALAPGMDMFDSVAVPAYPHDLLALESLSPNTVCRSFTIFSPKSRSGRRRQIFSMRTSKKLKAQMVALCYSWESVVS